MKVLIIVIAVALSLASGTEARLRRTRRLGVWSTAQNGWKLFNQGRTGSRTYNYINNRAKTQYSWAPSSRPNPETDWGARSSRAIGNWWNNRFDEDDEDHQTSGCLVHGSKCKLFFNIDLTTEQRHNTGLTTLGRTQLTNWWKTHFYNDFPDVKG